MVKLKWNSFARPLDLAHTFGSFVTLVITQAVALLTPCDGVVERAYPGNTVGNYDPAAREFNATISAPLPALGSPSEWGAAGCNGSGYPNAFAVAVLLSLLTIKAVLHDLNMELLWHTIGPAPFTAHWLERARILLIILATAAFFFLGEDSWASQGYQSLVATAIYCTWFAFIARLRSLPAIGPVLIIIQNAAKDIVLYVVVLLIIVFATATSFFTIRQSTSDFSQTLFDTYELIISGADGAYVLWGESDDTTLPLSVSTFSRIFGSLMFIVTSMAGSLVVLNIIIAQLSHSFEETLTKAEQQRHVHKAALVLFYERLYTPDSVKEGFGVSSSAIGTWFASVSQSVATFRHWDYFSKVVQELESNSEWLHMLVETGANTPLWRGRRGKSIAE